MKKLFKKTLIFFLLPLSFFLVGYLSFFCFFPGEENKKTNCFFPLKNKLFIKANPVPAVQPNSRKTTSYNNLYTSEMESRAKKMMEEARRLHTNKDYKTANKILTTLLNQYSYTGYIEEASYLLAKGLFYEGKFLQSEQVIDRLKKEYDSQSKWLGYALLIQGQIYEQKGKLDKSLRLYRQVIMDFSDTDLVNTAENFLNDIPF